MTIRIRVVASVLSVLSVLVASGCAGGSEVSTLSGDTESSEVFETDAPDPSDPSSENTDDGGGGGPAEPEVVSVALPSLPVGGGDELTGTTPQCVSVAWNDLGEIPDGLVFAVTGVIFDPADSFAVADETCEPPCLGSGFQPTSNSSCLVPVVWTGHATEATMSVVASADCPAEQIDACQTFADGLADGSITLTATPGEVDRTDEPSPDEPSPDESSPDESSSPSPDGEG